MASNLLGLAVIMAIIGAICVGALINKAGPTRELAWIAIVTALCAVALAFAAVLS